MKYFAFILLLQFGGYSLSAQESPSPTPDASISPNPEAAVLATPTPNSETEFEAKMESAVESLFESKSVGSASATGVSPNKSGISIKIGAGDKKNPDKEDKSDNHGISIHVEGDGKDETGITPERFSGMSILKNVLLPIVAIIMIFGSPVFIVGLVLFYRMKKNRLLHQTIQNLVASGQPIPPELFISSGVKTLPTANSDRRRGIIFTIIGVGLITNQIANGDPLAIGLIPLMIGVAYLLTAKFAPRGGNNDGAKN